jgi:hypothetical protein
MVTGPEKRLPGQSNAEYDRGSDANADYLGTQSLHGGGDLSWVMKAADAVRRWLERRKTRP